MWHVSSSSSVGGLRTHARTLRIEHRQARVEHTLKGRHTRLHPNWGKVSAPASVMNNWVIWLCAEIAISPHKCENITCHRKPGNWCCHVGLHVYACGLLTVLAYIGTFVIFCVLICEYFREGVTVSTCLSLHAEVVTFAYLSYKMKTYQILWRWNESMPPSAWCSDHSGLCDLKKN